MVEQTSLPGDDGSIGREADGRIPASPRHGHSQVRCVETRPIEYGDESAAVSNHRAPTIITSPGQAFFKVRYRTDGDLNLAHSRASTLELQKPLPAINDYAAAGDYALLACREESDAERSHRIRLK